MRVQAKGKVTKNLDGVMTEKWVRGPRFAQHLSSILSGSAIQSVSRRLRGRGREMAKALVPTGAAVFSNSPKRWEISH